MIVHVYRVTDLYVVDLGDDLDPGSSAQLTEGCRQALELVDGATPEKPIVRNEPDCNLVAFAPGGQECTSPP